MKIELKGILFLATLSVVGILFLKLKTPLHYAEMPIRPEAFEHVRMLTAGSSPNDPVKTGARYLYFKTDNNESTPERIVITSKQLSGGRLRITYYDPSARCDSVRSSIDRIYLKRNDQDVWLPVGHEWAHKGRGRFGWTTKRLL